VTRRSPAGFEEATANLADMLDSLSGADNYLDFIIDLMSLHLQSPVLEVGAGLGDLTGRLADRHRVVATDVSTRCLDALQEKFGENPNVTVAGYDVVAGGSVPEQPDEGFGSVVMSNVLEHLPDDEAVLAKLSKVLRPGGSVIIFVPAFELLYGKFDQMIGHHRRYRRRGLEQVLTAAGFTEPRVRYVNLPGWFAWLLTVRVMGLIPTSPGAVKTYDRVVLPVVRRIESWVAPPFGQSVLGVAQVPVNRPEPTLLTRNPRIGNS